MSYGGSPVLSYGTNGFVTLQGPSGSGPLTIFANASALQADGKTVVAEYEDSNPFGGTGGTQAVVVARYNLNGTPDTTFNTSGFFTDPTLTVSDSTVFPVAKAVGLQPDGKILVAADVSGPALVFRLNTDGTLDTTFGTGGFVTLGTPGSNDGKLDSVASLAVRRDGTIAVGGQVGQSSTYTPGVAVLDANGATDTVFGTGGLVEATLPAGQLSFEGIGGGSDQDGLAVQPDGSIVFATTTLNVSLGSAGGVVEGVVNRFTPSGTLDTTFGTGGQVIVTGQSIVGSGDIELAAVALQTDGKIVLGGNFKDSTGYAALAMRLNADGTRDGTFGIGGVDIVSGPDTLQQIGSIAIEPDGKILMGDANNARLLRFDTNGLPDVTFGAGGLVTPPRQETNFDSSVAGIGFLASGQISIVVGGFGNSLDHLLDQGSKGDYDTDGISDPAAFDTTTATFTDVPSGGGTPASTQIGDLGAGYTIPAPGAYDGDGISEVAVYRPAYGTFDVKPYTGCPDVITQFGTPGLGGSIPAPGDYDGSGRTELAVYVPSLGDLIYRPADGGRDVVVPIGVTGQGQTIPAPADYFGTGQDDVAVYLVAQGAYEIQNPVTGQDITVPFGTPGAGQAIPVPGDYDGSGHAELAVYVPASGDLIYRPGNGGPDVIVRIGLSGVAASIPEIGDYDGSGHDEPAVYEPSTGMLVYQPASSGSQVSLPVGTANESVAFSPGTEAVAVSGIDAFVAGDFFTSHGLTVSEFNPSGDFVRSFTVSQSVSYGLNGITFGPDGLLYASTANEFGRDFGVVALDSNGAVKAQYTTSTYIGGSVSDGKIAFGADGHFYVGAGGGLYQFTLGDPTSGKLLYDDYPGGATDVVVLPSGNLLISDSGSIKEITSEGTYISNFSTPSLGFNLVGGLAYDASTNSLYATMLGYTGEAYQLMKFHFGTGALLAQTTFYYGDDIALTEGGDLLVGSDAQSPGIFDANLNRIGTVGGSSSLFVAVAPASVPEPSSLHIVGLGMDLIGGHP